MSGLELVPRLALFTCIITSSNARLRMQTLEIVKVQVKNASIGTSSKTGILSCIITNSNARLRIQLMEVVKLQVKNVSIGTSSKTGTLSCIITCSNARLRMQALEVVKLQVKNASIELVLVQGLGIVILKVLKLVSRLAFFTFTITNSNAGLRMQALEVVKLQVKNASIELVLVQGLGIVILKVLKLVSRLAFFTFTITNSNAGLRMQALELVIDDKI